VNAVIRVNATWWRAAIDDNFWISGKRWLGLFKSKMTGIRR
jgi:hypothetical protein